MGFPSGTGFHRADDAARLRGRPYTRYPCRVEPAIHAEYTDAVRASVAVAVGVAPDAMQDLGGFESFVHEAEIGGRPRIVKATWGGRRSAEEMGAEVHFVNALSDGGATVCRALPLRGGELVATVPSASGEFHVTSFVKAPGGFLPRAEWTPETLTDWGALAGRLHRLSSAYPGPPPPLHRPSWEDDFASIRRLVAGESEIAARFDSLIAKAAVLPRDPGAFGYMHTDLHCANVFWHDGDMHVFDFEDTLEFWFVADLSIVLYYALLGPIWTKDLQADYDTARDALLEGYAREHTLPESSWAALELFMSLREHTLRAVILRSIPVAERGDWHRKYVPEVTARILAGDPPLGLQI